MKINPVLELHRCSFQRKDARGTFFEYFNSDKPWKAVNGGTMKKGAVMGNHYHKKSTILFVVMTGSVKVAAVDVRKPRSKPTCVTLKATDAVTVFPYATHTVTFLERSSFLLLKSHKYLPKSNDLYSTDPVKG